MMHSSRPKIPRRLAEFVFDRDGGKCVHCGKVLTKSKRSSYHLDHYPVQYRDIEGQLCCGVTSALDETNLVLSCPPVSYTHLRAHET